jgi:hypothetical protein
MNPKKRKYSNEILRIKQLNMISKVLKKGDVENAFLNSTDKDVEAVQDSAAERMLEELHLTKNEAKELQMLDSLVTEQDAQKPIAQQRSRAGRARRARSIKAGRAHARPRPARRAPPKKKKGKR